MRPSNGLLANVLGKELAHRLSDFLGVCFQSEVPAIDEADLGGWHITFERLSTRRNVLRQIRQA